MKRRGSQYKQFKRWLFSLPTVIVMAVLVGLVAIAAGNMYETYQQTDKTVQRLKKEQTQLKQRKQAVETAAAEISTNRGLKGEIRKKFSVAKPGERVIVLNESERPTPTSTEPKSAGWWQQAKATIRFW